LDITVIGLGYVGLPTALLLASKGYEVLGVDINETHLKRIEDGTVYFDEPIWQKLLKENTLNHNFKTSDTLTKSDTYIIAVPTPVKDSKLDMTYIFNVLDEIADVLERGNVIILESTVKPGITKEIGEILYQKTQLIPGKDFYLAHVPERVIPGNSYYELINNSRLIGGINDISSQKVYDIYNSFVKGEMIKCESEYAEISKIVENSFRDLNIAFANEVLLISEKLGLDPWKVIENANRHPRVNILNPGIGVGGHCIPVDPWFLHQGYPEEAGLVLQARLRNDYMPIKVSKDIQSLLEKYKKKKVAILGCAYKPDSNDDRESPVYEIVKNLISVGVEVTLFDPNVKSHREFKIENTLESAVNDVDIIVIAVAHKEFLELSPSVLRSITPSIIILDCTNMINKDSYEANNFDMYLLGNLKVKGEKELYENATVSR